MRKVLIALAAMGSFGVGPAVYAMSDGSTNTCASAKAAGLKTVCDTCENGVCTGCEVVGETSSGKPIL